MSFNYNPISLNYNPYSSSYYATTMTQLPIGSSYPTTYLTDLYQQMINKNEYTGTIPSVPLIYSNNNKTTYTYGTQNGMVSYSYDNLNKDKKTQKTLTKYYFYKTLDKWLYKELIPLLGFVEIVNDSPKLITSMGDYDGEKLFKDTREELEKKINYMEKILINKDVIKHMLKKVISKYNTNWAELEDYEQEIKKVFFNYLKNKLEDAVRGTK